MADIPSPLPGIPRAELERLIAQDALLARAREGVSTQDPRYQELGLAHAAVLKPLYEAMSVAQLARRIHTHGFAFLLHPDPRVHLGQAPTVTKPARAPSAGAPAKSRPRRSAHSTP